MTAEFITLLFRLHGAYIVAFGLVAIAITATAFRRVAGRLKNWKQEDFVRLVRTGVLPNGKHLGPAMSSKTFGEMSDMELAPLWLYFADAKL